MKNTLTAHGRAAVLCAWLALYSYALPAAAQGIAASASMSEGLRQYDLAFLVWGIAVASIGGLGRTVLTLLSQRVAILSVLRETWKDLFIAALAGVIASMVLLAVQSLGVGIPVPVTVLVLGICGWARMGFFVWAEKSARTVADRGTQWAADKISRPDPYARRAGGDAPRDTPGPPRAAALTNPDDMEP